MRFAWFLFVLASSGVDVGWVDHPVAVVAARVPCNDRQAQEDQQRCQRDLKECRCRGALRMGLVVVAGMLGCRLLLRLRSLLLV